MGLYIEHYFEEKGIRFIAVAEGIDSKKGLDNLMLPMTNVINSLYARQASTKTKAAHRRGQAVECSLAAARLSVTRKTLLTDIT